MAELNHLRATANAAKLHSTGLAADLADAVSEAIGELDEEVSDIKQMLGQVVERLADI